MRMEAKIENVLNKIRPFLRQDGGGVELIKFENGIVYLKVLGACIGCIYQDQHINKAIEEILINEISGIIGVKVIS